MKYKLLYVHYIYIMHMRITYIKEDENFTPQLLIILDKNDV